MESQTPMMRQYWKIKESHKDAILFFRMGDFYEMFHQDAETASKVLGLTLTSRSTGEKTPIPLAGVPWHKADHYIDRLLSKGFKVAVCDQTEDPRKAKGLVRREVTEVITPGTALTGSLLEGKRPNYLMALAPSAMKNSQRVGVAVIDVTTGDFRIGEVLPSELAEEVSRFGPAEILLPEGKKEDLGLRNGEGKDPLFSEREEWRFDAEEGERTLKDHFRVETLDGFGCTSLRLGLAASAVLFGYLREIGRNDLRHVDRVLLINTETHMILDETTRRNLEIFRPIRESSESATLLPVIDSTVTAMGGRLLREWILRPLIDPALVESRLEAVDEGVRRSSWREEARKTLGRFSDLERLAGRIVLGRGNPRDIVALKNTLELIPELRERFTGSDSALFREIAEELNPLHDLVERIGSAILDEPSVSVRDGKIIREGYSSELDELRGVGASGQSWIADFQKGERERTGIPNLKVGFNRVFGYYIEVSKARGGETPPTYVRKQTLVNAERYITPELKEQEEKILGAEEKIRQLEEELFLEVRAATAAEGPAIRRLGEAAAALDVLVSFADVAVRRGYSRPVMNSGSSIRIRKGRHPVVEAILGPGEFIPNDTYLDSETSQIHILTGPNMAGKSTYIRQVALIQILAQCGSFIPAQSAEIGMVDRVFTRVGASDDVARGQSTFLVEMTETANILHNATSKSLVLLDEIGRGTSTFDGVSIAWAVVEYLHRARKTAAKTLFATHYHELSVLADKLDRVHNYSVLVKEWRDRVVFLRQVVSGSVDRSYGIQVARLAGLPEEVIARAKEVLRHLENEHTALPLDPGESHIPLQISLFQSVEERIMDELRSIDPDSMTPMESLRKIREWRDRTDGGGDA